VVARVGAAAEEVVEGGGGVVGVLAELEALLADVLGPDVDVVSVLIVPEAGAGEAADVEGLITVIRRSRRNNQTSCDMKYEGPG
jgi:hypothetical protein